MASQITVNGKSTTQPGVYADTRSGVVNPTQPLNFPNTVCLIDTGQSTGFVGGIGVSGVGANGQDTIYTFNSLQQARSVVRGGRLYKTLQYLFNPAPGVRGASKVYFIRAATTTQASLALTLSAVAVTFKTKNEGTGSNGVLVSTELTRGFAAKMIAGSASGKYRLQFYVGTYTGPDALNSNVPYDGQTEATCKGLLLLTTKDFGSVQELLDILAVNNTFNGLFTVSAATGTLTTAITSDEATTVGSAYKLFASATETYDAGGLTSALACLSDLDNQFFLAPGFGATSLSTQNTGLLAHLKANSIHRRYMVVGGGLDESAFVGTSHNSVDAARTYNDSQVLVIHGGFKETDPYTGQFYERDTYDSAALVLGLLAGRASQDPLVLKSIPVSALKHNLLDEQKETALSAGVIFFQKDRELGFVLTDAVNTNQKNNFLVNPDGSSHDVATERIVSQIRYDVVTVGKTTFFGGSIPLNRGNFTTDDVKTWLIGFLERKVREKLIISYSDIAVSVTGDTYYVTYKFEPNFPIKKLVFTGIIVDNAQTITA